jgi:cytochrome c biogenesis protein CcdA/DsbC/DsbD-like thiol-disulfide interchange protein
MHFFIRKVFLAATLLMLLHQVGNAQSQNSLPADPTHWTFEAKKISGDKYNIEFHVTLDTPWHIYSFKPGAAGLLPPKFTFNPNDKVKLVGAMQEKGKLIKEDDGVGDILHYYEKSVDYVQQAIVTGDTKIEGMYKYQVCNHTTCHNPVKKAFSITIGNPPATASSTNTDSATSARTTASDAPAGQAPQLVLEKSADTGSLKPQKYVSEMMIYEPGAVRKLGLTTYFYYEEALAAARKLKRPLMLDFTGITCVNCRKMETQVWANPDVLARLKDSFVVVSLYCDADQVELLPEDRYKSKQGAKITTLGDKNLDLGLTRFGASTQPYYFFVDDSERLLYPTGYSYDPDAQKFARLLDTVKKRYREGLSSKLQMANMNKVVLFFGSLGGGIAALLTPCIYSMIPITVSFFTKRSKNRKEGLRNALFYSFSVIIIFTLLGVLVSLLFGPSAIYKLSTNWIANLLFFFLFVVFGISFLGAFEITLPSSWTNKTDSKAGLGSFAGIFFMALTLVIVSFSCTGPIVGPLLLLASRGGVAGPAIGMLGFSLGLSLPFAIFAMFPGLLNKMASSGGWLNQVKVTLGFLELALAMKFLSNADLVMHWRILDREIFISIWIVISVLLGMYLLGKLKLSHDDEPKKNLYGQEYVSLFKLFLAIGCFTFALYLFPGLWGAPLNGLGQFIPPVGTQDFILGGANMK